MNSQFVYAARVLIHCQFREVPKDYYTKEWWSCYVMDFITNC